MATIVGHVAPGLGYFLIGIWHLLNHISLHALHPKGYTSFLWFPSPKIRHLELFLIMFGCLTFISTELFIGKNHPLDSDGTIPSSHLHYFEHSNISLVFFVYALFSLILDKFTPTPPSQNELTYFLGAIAFGIELLLFHLHSTDHTGIEGQYHWLLQIVIFVCLVTTLLGIPLPNSFMNSFIRSYSIMFHGIWLMVTGVMLWTPQFMAKDCFWNMEQDGHKVVRCHDHEALERAKSVVNIQFSWYLVGISVFSVSLYLVVIKILIKEEVEYQSLITSKFEEQEDDLEVDVEADHQKKRGVRNGGESKRFLEMGKVFAPPCLQGNRHDQQKN